MPLYRFPFGTHRGKTLLKVPENYISYLRIDQNMAESMAGFDAALRLFDAGQPPVAPLPPLSFSQPEQVRPPLNAPARTSSSQQDAKRALFSTQDTAASPVEYRFDFGIHRGKTLTEVPSEYVIFLKKHGIVEGKPAVAVAVIKHERKKPQSAAPASSQPSKDPAEYRLKFGKHIGKTVSEVPDYYLRWRKSIDMLDDNEDLRHAVAYNDRLRKPAKRRAPKPKVRQVLKQYW